MSDEHDMRRRRALYRAHHRGTKEMDILIGRFADARVDALDAEGLAQFEEFLALPDPTLEAWIFAKENCAGTDFAGLVGELRAFHGLDSVETGAK